MALSHLDYLWQPLGPGSRCVLTPKGQLRTPDSQSGRGCPFCPSPCPSLTDEDPEFQTDEVTCLGSHEDHNSDFSDVPDGTGGVAVISEEQSVNQELSP